MTTDPTASTASDVRRQATASADPTAQANPLQLSQWSYLAQDLALIAIQPGGNSTALSRITVTAGEDGAQNPTYTFQNASSLTIADYNEILCATALNNSQSGCQELAILSTSGADPLALNIASLNATSGNLETATYTVSSSSVTFVIDYLPTAFGKSPGQAQQGPLLLAGVSGSTLNIFTFDTSSTPGTLAGPWTLPIDQGSTLVSGHLVRYDLNVRLMFLVLVGGVTLKAYSVLPSSLGGSPGAMGVDSVVTVGTVSSSSSISATVTQAMQSSGQQLAVAFLDAKGSPTLGILSFDASGDLEVFQTLDVGINSAAPAGKSIRVAAADFANQGVAQIVVAFAATYGGLDGCLALALASWDPSTEGFSKASTYVCIAPNNVPLASIDLRIAAGVFWADGPSASGGTLGVAVMGCGGSMEDLMQGNERVIIDMIPVAPTLAFPSYSASAPAQLVSPLNVYVDQTVSSIIGLGVDFQGLSVVLGPPTIQSIESYSQIIAIIGSPPYSAADMASPPTLTFSETESKVKGVSISSNRNWTQSNDLTANVNVSDLGGTKSINNTYGTDFSKTADNTITSSVTESMSIQSSDQMLVYAMSYTAWQYPVYQVSRNGKKPAGTILVVFPDQVAPSLAIGPAYSSNLTWGYVQPYENGNLLSYVGLLPDGYSASDHAVETLFDTNPVTVANDSGGGVTATYDSSRMTSSTTTGGKTVTTNLSTGGSLTASTNLFNYLPVNFGMTITNSSNYTKGSSKNTNISYTKDLSISIQFGTVSDASMEYSVTPLIYQHPVLGCLYIGYQVTNLGHQWASTYNKPAPMVVRPFRASTDPVLATYSPSISFSSAPGAIQIETQVFNSSFVQATSVVCTAYPGLPDTSGATPAPPSAKPIGSVTLGTFEGLARQTASIGWPEAKGAVTIVLTMNGTQMDIAWAAYPPSDASDILSETR